MRRGSSASRRSTSPARRNGRRQSSARQAHRRRCGPPSHRSRICCPTTARTCLCIQAEGAGSMPSANDAAAQQLANAAASGSPLDMLFQQFGQQEAMELLNLLMADLQAGINPRQIAREMSNKFDELSYGRAETIARTESLGSWNDAALENYRANSDVLGSWMWMCTPGAGTCVSCLEEDGTIYGLDEELDDHPNGRCCKMPVTNDYGSILGAYRIPRGEGDFVPAPWEDRQTGEDWLLAQDAETQRAAFGSIAAFNARHSGDVSLKDFVCIRKDHEWSDSTIQSRRSSTG